MHCVSITRLTCTQEPCSFKCVWGGTCTCPLSSCWWSLLSTRLQVHDRCNHVYNSICWNKFHVLRYLKISRTHVLFLSGGLAAVIYTDTLQTVVMIIGAIILTITGLYSTFILTAVFFLKNWAAGVVCI